MSGENPGIRISKKAFLTSFFVLLGLMIAAGLLTVAIPSGRYDRIEGEFGPEPVPGSYMVVEKPDYPVWRWFTAPVEVLGSEDGLQAIVIIAFIMIVGGAFAVLQAAGVLKAAIGSMARRFASQKYLLLALVSLFFMSIGSFMGIFEEVIPMVPVAIALSVSLGWDVMTGLGMSILATGFGFSAAVANPFSIGTAQRLACLPLFSGSLFRILVFVVVYALFLFWLYRTARRAERNAPGGAIIEGRVQASDSDAGPGEVSAAPLAAHPGRGAVFFGVSMVVLIAVVMTVSLTGTFAEYSMPIIAVLFLIAGFGSGLAAGLQFKRCLSAFGSGVVSILPGVVLILMAMGVKHIIVSGMVMDSILAAAARTVAGSSGYAAAALVYLFTLIMNFFIGSATAKAFLLMPILVPLADLTGLTRQIVVQAFAFGDGFSNMLYPTNAVLLISLGIAGISWPTWFKRTWPLQVATLIVTMGLLMLAVATGYS